MRSQLAISTVLNSLSQILELAALVLLASYEFVINVIVMNKRGAYMYYIHSLVFQ